MGILTPLQPSWTQLCSFLKSCWHPSYPIWNNRGREIGVSHSWWHCCVITLRDCLSPVAFGTVLSNQCCLHSQDYWVPKDWPPATAPSWSLSYWRMQVLYQVSIPGWGKEEFSPPKRFLLNFEPNPKLSPSPLESHWFLSSANLVTRFLCIGLSNTS